MNSGFSRDDVLRVLRVAAEPTVGKSESVERAAEAVWHVLQTPLQPTDEPPDSLNETR
ncbi:MAG: hypothetical protein JOY61_17000 [Chloroflexi bacterium]|nr:hypothetical protein [Chloroflexota bacterium]